MVTKISTEEMYFKIDSLESHQKKGVVDSTTTPFIGRKFIKLTFGVQIHIPAPIPGIKCIEYRNKTTWTSVSVNLISS